MKISNSQQSSKKGWKIKKEWFSFLKRTSYFVGGTLREEIFYVDDNSVVHLLHKSYSRISGFKLDSIDGGILRVNNKWKIRKSSGEWHQTPPWGYAHPTSLGLSDKFQARLNPEYLNDGKFIAVSTLDRNISARLTVLTFSPKGDKDNLKFEQVFLESEELAKATKKKLTALKFKMPPTGRK